MSSKKFLSKNNMNKAAFVVHRNQNLSFINNNPLLIKVTWTVIILFTINLNNCTAEELLYKHLAQRLLLSNDSSFHILSELFRRCFDANRRLLTIAAQGESLPEEVISEAHSRNIYRPVIIIRGDKLKEINRTLSGTSQPSSDMFTLFVDISEQVETLLDSIKSLPFWNPRGRFMVVISYPLFNDREVFIEKLFHRMWTEKILEVLVVFRYFSTEHCAEHTDSCSLLTSDVQVATYNPFRHFKGINYITDTWYKTNDVKVHFPSLSDMNGYPLRSVMLHEPLGAVPVVGSNGRIQILDGYDGQTMHSLAQYMNAVMVFVPRNDNATYGMRSKNGTITGNAGDVAYGRADIAANSQYTKFDLTELEHTYPHDANNLCFLVPKSQRVPQFRNLFLPFPELVWAVLLCAIILTSACWYFVRKYDEISLRRRTRMFGINEAFFDIFRSFITGIINEVPASTLGRLFIVTWLLLAMIITNAFQGSLTSFLAVPKYLPQINTLKSLDDAGLGIYVSPGVKTMMTLDVDDKIMTNLWRKFQYGYNLSSFSNMADRMAVKRDSACIFNDLIAQLYLRNSRYTKDGYPMLHRVQENILSVYLVYAVPRHSPFLSRFNVIIGRLVEAGLQRKWIGDSLHRPTLDGNITPVALPHAAEPAPLGLYHLQTAFYLLIIGLLCSTVVFIVQRIMQVL